MNRTNYKVAKINKWKLLMDPLFLLVKTAKVLPSMRVKVTTSL